MLPYFKIIPETGMEVPVKPKRNKRLDVPIHKHETRKNFSANFNKDEANEVGNVKTSRRILQNENERLSQENQELINAQGYLNKKNCKLKEKLNQMQEISNENQLLRLQYQELVNHCVELEKPKICQNCMELNDQIDKIKQDYQQLRQNNQELHEDCNMLKNVIYRLNVQLEKYQQKLHANKIPLKDPKNAATSNIPTDLNLGDNHLQHHHSPISWGKVNSHTLAPLLDAYQEGLDEKDEIIENYETELTQFTLKLKEIFKENERLYSLLNEDDACSRVLSLQLDNLKIELKTTKDQNDLLIKKCALKQDKVEEILKCYEQKVEQLQRDYSVLHDQYCRSKTEIVALKEKNKSLENAQDDFKSERSQYIPISVHNSSVNECKRWYEELKHQYEVEKLKLSENVEKEKSKLDEFQKEIAGLNKEKQELENKMKLSEKLVKKAESKYLELEHNLNEVQLSRSACRKQLHKAMNFAKDLVQEQESLLRTLNVRQQENKAVKKIGCNIASRMDLLRNELKTVQKEAWQELSTVEERLQEQDQMISRMKEDHEDEVERLKKIIRHKENNVLLKENASVSTPNIVLHHNKSSLK